MFGHGPGGLRGARSFCGAFGSGGSLGFRGLFGSFAFGLGGSLGFRGPFGSFAFGLGGSLGFRGPFGSFAFGLGAVLAFGSFAFGLDLVPLRGAAIPPPQGAVCPPGMVRLRGAIWLRGTGGDVRGAVGLCGAVGLRTRFSGQRTRDSP